MRIHYCEIRRGSLSIIARSISNLNIHVPGEKACGSFSEEQIGPKVVYQEQVPNHHECFWSVKAIKKIPDTTASEEDSRCCSFYLMVDSTSCLTAVAESLSYLYHRCHGASFLFTHEYTSSLGPVILAIFPCDLLKTTESYSVLLGLLRILRS